LGFGRKQQLRRPGIARLLNWGSPLIGTKKRIERQKVIFGEGANRDNAFHGGEDKGGVAVQVNAAT